MTPLYNLCSQVLPAAAYIHFPEARRSFLPTLTFIDFEKYVERDSIYP